MVESRDGGNNTSTDRKVVNYENGGLSADAQACVDWFLNTVYPTLQGTAVDPPGPLPTVNEQAYSHGVTRASHPAVLSDSSLGPRPTQPARRFGTDLTAVVAEGKLAQLRAE